MLQQLGRHHHVAHLDARREPARNTAEHDGAHAEALEQQRGRHRRRDLADARQHRDHGLALQVADPEVAARDAHALLVGHQREERLELLVHRRDDRDGCGAPTAYLMSTP